MHPSWVLYKNIVRKIVRGYLRKKKFEYISISGGKIKATVPVIEIPRFAHLIQDVFAELFGDRGKAKEIFGEESEEVAPGQKESAAGSEPGIHYLVEELSLEEYSSLLAEVFEWPELKPKIGAVEEEIAKGTTLAQKGTRRYFKKTFLEALKRWLLEGWDPEKDPLPVPPIEFIVKEDVRYRVRKMIREKSVNVVVVFINDISGSIGDEERNIQRFVCRTLSIYIEKFFRNAKTIYIVHDVNAKEVSEEEFYRLQTSGGTAISSALELVERFLLEEYPPHAWNQYVFQFSDGENLGADMEKCAEILERIFARNPEERPEWCYLQTRPREQNYTRLIKELSQKYPEIFLQIVSSLSEIDLTKLFRKEVSK